MANINKALKIMALSLAASVVFLGAEEYVTSNSFHLEPASGRPTADVSAIREAFHISAKIGDKMPDGTIYAGISPETNKPMYAPSSDAPLTYTFNEAKAYAKKLDEDGHQDWRVPTKAELNVLFNNRAAIGGFDVTGSYPAGWYWSASPGDRWNAWGQRFSDGCQFYNGKDSHSAVRCVR